MSSMSNHLYFDTCVRVLLQNVQERWYEKLHEWNKALAAYEQKNARNPDDVSYLLGRMRCLEALGQW